MKENKIVDDIAWIQLNEINEEINQFEQQLKTEMKNWIPKSRIEERIKGLLKIKSANEKAENRIEGAIAELDSLIQEESDEKNDAKGFGEEDKGKSIFG